MMINLWTALTFFGALLVGFVVIRLREQQDNTPANRVRGHLNTMLGLDEAPKAAPEPAPESNAALFGDLRRGESPIAAWLAERRERLLTVSGGKPQIFVAVVLTLAVVLGLCLAWLLPLSTWGWPVLLLIDPVLLLMFCYRWMIGRYQKRFLKQFPDALDLIIRAVRAGVPANQAITAAGKEFDAPLGTEFCLMGDALQLGVDLQEVLNEAEARIEVPDFSFFCVCLLLQRETGGQLTETLENLAQIIRVRCDMGMKARALTGEARAASKVIGVIPFLVMGMLWYINPDYILPLFVTASGLVILKLAIVLVAGGLFLISHLSNLKV
ncbi:type II secretion system F family protein [Paludibacterium purpuratum]|nr:type II secretion system F family protein [Paludibacterium purpuratum]